MKRNFTRLTFVFALLGLTAAAFAVRVGEQAPDFKAVDSNGQSRALSQHKGKYVVLEWHNNGCPYTRKHYESGNMQNLQKEWTAKGVVWFTVISSAPGTQGYVTAAEENAYLREMKASPTAALLDPQGTLGHLYNAKTTPEIFIIAPDGKLVYQGAIDDHPTSDAGDIPKSKNYVSVALTESMSGKPVDEPSTRSYGCSVKYAH
ncbi:MAG: redoxin domain-containing protein [Candidatus Korobacteraceae bacterium]|jgi:peroxiredoxin